mmetsp:Transcript_42316/g.99277  ORF Transcript_42316/g.99277 Transcript_42316/m.99277 type:complete len:241 (-) Transcript_42316:1918-2640(-)
MLCVGSPRRALGLARGRRCAVRAHRRSLQRARAVNRPAGPASPTGRCSACPGRRPRSSPATAVHLRAPACRRWPAGSGRVSAALPPSRSAASPRWVAPGRRNAVRRARHSEGGWSGRRSVSPWPWRSADAGRDSTGRPCSPWREAGPRAVRPAPARRCRRRVAPSRGRQAHGPAGHRARPGAWRTPADGCPRRRSVRRRPTPAWRADADGPPLRRRECVSSVTSPSCSGPRNSRWNGAAC